MFDPFDQVGAGGAGGREIAPRGLEIGGAGGELVGQRVAGGLAARLGRREAAGIAARLERHGAADRDREQRHQGSDAPADHRSAA